jgi:NAD(P)-dependent dehydrogenase (short-subunit alcohol dehydrogenase family)
MRVVVTGAGSGFGRAVARRLLARGDDVFATELLDEGLAERLLEGLDPHGGVHTHALDLRDPGVVRAAARHALATGPVDALVNNAGYGFFASQADADLDAVAALLDANVLGPARLTAALLPELRRRRGTVVQLSSVAGRMAFPESGYYAASKFGLEALSEALYVEHAEAGLRVAVIEPGAFATRFPERASRASGPRRPDSLHAPSWADWDARKAAALAPALQDPEDVADAVVAALDGGPAFQRVRVGTDAVRILELRDALGEDGWVRFLGERVGGPPELPGPAAVVAATDEALEGGAAFAGVRAAGRAGLLDHWAGPDADTARDRVARVLSRG